MGIAIILVILHHYYLGGLNLWGYTNRFLKQFEYGNVGVDIFLFLSAYGCCASIEHHKIKDFFLNRIRNIYPLYALFLILLVAIFRHPDAFEKVRIILLCMSGGAALLKANAYVDWYTPSLILMYFVLPMIVWTITCLQKRINTLKKYVWWSKTKIFLDYLQLILIIILSRKLVSLNVIYEALALRIPIITCGIYAYLHRYEKQKLFIIFSLLACTPVFIHISKIMFHSLLIPNLIIATSSIQLINNVLIRQISSVVGKNTFAIYLAQEIFVKKDTMPLLKFDNIGYSYLLITLFIIVVSICFVYYKNKADKLIVKLSK